MTTHSLQVGGQTLVARCDDAFAQQAESVIALFKRLHEEGRVLRDGFRVRFGWSLLTLRGHGSQLIVCEPDFSSDPLTNVREDITVTLSVLVQQSSVLNRLGVEGEDASFRYKLVISKGVLNIPHIYLERKESTTEDDSGWYIGPVEDPEEEPGYESLYVYQLLDSRPQLLQVLTLPRGYLAVFNGVEIEAILNESEENVWEAKA
jgi:hypothetical protein